MKAWRIFFIGSLFYFYSFLVEVSPGVISFDLISEFLIDNHRIGILSATFFLTYTLMQIPVGILLDQWGVRRLLPIAAIVCAIGCFIFGLAPYFFVTSIGRLIVGVGAAFAYIGSLKLVTCWFKDDKFALMTGVLNSIGGLGAIAGEEPLAYLVEQVGWRHSMFYLALLGIILASILFLFLKDSPKKEKLPPSKFSKLNIKEALAHVLKDKQLWLINGYCSLVAMPFFALSTLWCIPFLVVRYHISEIAAAKAVAFILIGRIIGSPLWGALSDYLKRRRPTLLIAVFGSVFVLLIIIYYPFSNLLIPQLLLFGFGFFSSGYSTVFSIAREISNPKHTAMALGFVNTGCTFLVIFSLPFLGRILDIFWDGKMQHGERIYALTDYQIAMTFVVCLIIVSLLFLAFIKETNAKPLYPQENE